MPKTWPVKGKVTFVNGSPVPTAGVRLVNDDTRFSTAGATKTDGTFELKTFIGDQTVIGAVEGEHHFEISGGPLIDNRPVQLRIVKPAKIKVEPKENEVSIEVEQIP